MKKLSALKRLSMLLMLIAIMQGCLKDTVTKTYTIYTPVYKSKAEVRAGIKSSAPVAVENPGKIFLYGKYIFLNEINKGVHIIDNTNPAAPVNKFFINIPGNVDLAVTGNTLYADLYTDLVTLDITDPSSVQIKKIIPNIFPKRQYLNGYTTDTTRLITEWIKKDTTVNGDLPYYGGGILYYASSSYQSAAAPTIGISGSMARFTLLNNFLYTVTDNALNVFNITKPDDPALSNTLSISGGIETIYPFKNNLFIGSQTGMMIYSAANPALPASIGTFTHARACDPVIADDNYAYVTLRTGSACAGTTNALDVVNVQNLPATTMVRSYPLTNPHGLSKAGNTLLVCDGTAGLKIYDATNPAGLQLLQTISGLDAYDVIALNGLAIVVGKDGLYEYDFTTPNKTYLLSKVSYKQ